MRYCKFIIVLIFAFNCSNQTSHKEKMFNQFKNEVTVNVFKDIPTDTEFINNSVSQNILFPEAIYASKYCGIFVEYQYDEVSFFEKIKSFNTVKIFESNLDDTCNLLVPFERTENDCNKDYLPVPNTEDDFNNIEVNKLKARYIVFNHEKGLFIKNKPKDQEFGYGFSNGVIIDEDSKKMIYWIIIW